MSCMIKGILVLVVSRVPGLSNQANQCVQVGGGGSYRRIRNVVYIKEINKFR